MKTLIDATTKADCTSAPKRRVSLSMFEEATLRKGQSVPLHPGGPRLPMLDYWAKAEFFGCRAGVRAQPDIHSRSASDRSRMLWATRKRLAPMLANHLATSDQNGTDGIVWNEKSTAAGSG